MNDKLKEGEVLKHPELIHQAVAFDAQIDAIYKQIDALRAEALELTKERDTVVCQMRGRPVLTVVRI